jgi:hypothetical protein
MASQPDLNVHVLYCGNIAGPLPPPTSAAFLRPLLAYCLLLTIAASQRSAVRFFFSTFSTIFNFPFLTNSRPRLHCNQLSPSSCSVLLPSSDQRRRAVTNFPTNLLIRPLIVQLTRTVHICRLSTGNRHHKHHLAKTVLS